MMDWTVLAKDFEEEVADAAKYAGMAHQTKGCDRQVFMGMAWEEYSHAKHIHRMMEEHDLPTAGHRDVLHRTKEIIEES